MQRLGGYPRLWRRNGDHWDGLRLVPDDQVTDYEAAWREVHVRVEWLRSPHGRIDHLLPQTILRDAANQNVRSWRERRTGVTLRRGNRKDMLRNVGNKRNVTGF